MDDTRFVQVEDRDSIRWMRFHNPQHKNAIPRHGWEEIGEAITSFALSKQRVLVIGGSGFDFCSGADLRAEDIERLDSPAEARRLMHAPGRAALALHRLPKPTIAAVDGAAVGAGMNLAIGCDIVVATTRARFSEVFVRRGLNLDLGGVWLLPRLVGMARAKDLALSGRIVSGAEAAEIGLASRVVEPDRLDATVGELARELADGAPLAQRFIKMGLSRSFDLTFEQALAYEQQSQAALLASDDAREGIVAFLEDRRPEFGGS